jgi:hypothetical protein
MDDPAVTKTYSLSIKHINIVSDIARRFNVSQGQVVRRAIEKLSESLDGGEGLFEEKKPYHAPTLTENGHVEENTKRAL